MRALLWALVMHACAATAALAARPDPASDCASFTALQSSDGRLWEVRGLACRMAGQALRIEIRERRVTDPAQILKQGLIW
jgi:hypothetical protein